MKMTDQSSKLIIFIITKKHLNSRKFTCFDRYSMQGADTVDAGTEDKSPVVVCTTKSVCKRRELTGEKASSLAMLTSISDFIKQPQQTCSDNHNNNNTAEQQQVEVSRNIT